MFKKNLWTPRTGVFQLDREACEGTSKFLQHQSTNKVPKPSCHPTVSPRFFFCWFKKSDPWKNSLETVGNPSNDNESHASEGSTTFAGWWGHCEELSGAVAACWPRWVTPWPVGWLEPNKFFWGKENNTEKMAHQNNTKTHVIYLSQLIHRYTPDEMMYQCFSWIGMFYCQCFSINREVFFLLFC